MRSAWGVSVSVSVTLLLAGLGSVTPAGPATLAVLASVPVAKTDADGPLELRTKGCGAAATSGPAFPFTPAMAAVPIDEITASAQAKFQEFMKTDAAADAEKNDGVRPETLLVLSEGS